MTHNTLSIRRLASGIALAAVLPLAAACSGASTPTATSTPAASSVTSTTVSPLPTTSTTASAAGDVAAYCSTLKSSWAELQTLTGNIGDRQGLPKALALLNGIRAAAPAEVKPAWDDFIGLIEAAGSGDTKGVAEAMQKMASATETITAQAKTECGIDLGS